MFNSEEFKKYLQNIQIKDTVHRSLGGSKPMTLKVTEIDENFIYCGPKDIGWKFCKDTGLEVDEFLKWGPERSGSWLTYPN